MNEAIQPSDASTSFCGNLFSGIPPSISRRQFSPLALLFLSPCYACTDLGDITEDGQSKKMSDNKVRRSEDRSDELAMLSLR